MSFLTFLGYYLIVDAILSFSMFLLLKKKLPLIKMRLQEFLGIDNLRREVVDVKLDIDNIETYLEETEDELPKPSFKKAMDEVFETGGS